jgi:hypothetical protein
LNSYYEEHKNEIRNYVKDYYERNKEAKARYSREYYQKHKNDLLFKIKRKIKPEDRLIQIEHKEVSLLF